MSWVQSDSINGTDLQIQRPEVLETEALRHPPQEEKLACVSLSVEAITDQLTPDVNAALSLSSQSFPLCPYQPKRVHI